MSYNGLIKSNRGCWCVEIITILLSPHKKAYKGNGSLAYQPAKNCPGFQTGGLPGYGASRIQRNNVTLFKNEKLLTEDDSKLSRNVLRFCM